VSGTGTGVCVTTVIVECGWTVGVTQDRRLSVSLGAASIDTDDSMGSRVTRRGDRGDILTAGSHLSRSSRSAKSR
jgi:hypothetical protein